MTLGTAVLLLALAVAGIVLAFRCLRKKSKLRIILPSCKNRRREMGLRSARFTANP